MSKRSLFALLLVFNGLLIHASEIGAVPGSNASSLGATSLEMTNGLRVLVNGSLRDALYSEVLLVVRAGLGTSATREELARVSAEALTAGRRSPSDPPVRVEMARLGVTLDSTVGREFVVFRFAVPTVNTSAFLHLLGLLLSRDTIPVEVWAAAIERSHRSAVAEQSDSWFQCKQQLRDLIWKSDITNDPPPPAITTRAADRKVLNDFWQKAYFPGNMVLSVWGSPKPEELVPMIQDAFTYGFAPARSGVLSVPGEPVLKHNGSVDCEQSDGASPAALLVGIGATLGSDESFYAFQIAAHILGASYNSRLQRRLREQSQVVYTVEAQDIPIGRDGITLQIACQTDQVEATRDIILNELTRLTKEPVEQQELDYARAILRSRLMLDASSVRERFFRESLKLLANHSVRDPGHADSIISGFTPPSLLRALQSTTRSPEPSTFVLSAHPEHVCEATHASN